MQSSRLVVAFLASSAWSQSPPPRPTIDTQKDQRNTTGKSAPATTNDHQSDSISSSIDKLTAEIRSWKDERDSKTQESDPLSKWWLKWGNLVAASASAVAALVTAGLIAIQSIVMHKQRLAMDKQAELMDKTLSETGRAATATRDSVTQASDTAIRQLRAYVGAHQVGVMGIEDADAFGVGFVFINHGQTPASKFNLRGVVDLFPYPLPNDFVFPDPPDRPTQDGIIFPNESNPMMGWVWEREGQRLSIKDKLTLFSKNTIQEFYAHGTASYCDIFGVSRECRFCFYLNPSSVIRNQVGVEARPLLTEITTIRGCEVAQSSISDAWVQKPRLPIERKCIACLAVKPAGDFFSFRYTTANGKLSVRLDSTCKVCTALQRSTDEARTRKG